MARSAPAFSSFTAGEVSPRMEGRVTLDTYREGLADMTNLLVLPQGGVTRRPGTEYLGEIKNSAQAARLIPFQFKTTDTYILEFGNQTMRVFRSGLQVLDATDKVITGITQADPGVITSNSHGFSDGDEIFVDAIVGMTELNGRNYRVDNATTNTFTLTDLFGNDIDTTSFTAYGSAGTATEIYNIATPYAVADLPALRFVQSADTMFIVHPSYAIRKLTRTADNNWTFSTASITGSPSPALNDTTNNYPSVVTFFEQRLVFGATNNNPQTLWFSKNGDYENFTTGTGDDDALVYTIASNQVNAIRYLSATRVLTIGTTGGEYVLTATSDGPVTPTTTLIRKYSNYGSAAVEPVQVADVTLFVQRGGRKVREFRYVGDINVSAYQAPDITIVAEHITAGGLSAFAYQQEPDGVIWVVRADGTLLGVTYRREEEVVAWHKHVIGGEFSGGQAVVESIATLPSDTGEDELYMIVKRTINGVTKRYVEQMRPFNFGGVTTGAFFVDCGLRYEGTATGTLSGLYHLEGETVTVLANGATHPDREVTGGGITLAYNSTTAAVGYNYTSSMQTMRIEAGSADGTSQGKPKRIHAVTLRLLETVGIEVGNSAGENDRVFFRDSSMLMDEAVPLFTGDKDIEFPGGYDDDDRLYVRQTQPLPMSVLALFPRMNTFDK
jgi:hypothetical protein